MNKWLNKVFLESFMTLLKRRRGKSGLFKIGKGIKKDKAWTCNKVEFQMTKKWKWYVGMAEEKALYLIQLWADTFMMHQDRFAGVHEWYKQLRLESVEFPERDPNERLMMENLKGIDSPMFDFVEQTSGKEKPKALEEIKREKRIQDDNQIVEVIDEEGKEEFEAFGENEDFSNF